MQRTLRSLFTLAATLAPATAMAHPGHGSTDPESLSHYLTDPLHASVLGLALGLVIACSIGWRRHRRASASLE